MVLYSCIILFLIYFSLGKVKKIDKVTILKIVMFFLWFLASTRTLEIGNDTKTYYNEFHNVAVSASLKPFISRYEIGYLLLSKIVSWVRGDFWLFLAIENAIVYYAYYLLFKRYSLNPILSVFLFFVFGSWGSTLNVIRLQLAVAMTIYAFLCKENRKTVLFVIFLILSVCFHRIALTHVIAFLAPKKFSGKFSFISILITAVLLFFLPILMRLAALIVPYYSHYLSYDIYVLGEVKLAVCLSVLMKLLLLLLVLYVYKADDSYNDRLIARESDIAYQFNLVFLSEMFLIASLRFNLLDRCSYFYSTFSYVLIPNVISHLNEKYNRIILFTAFIFIGVAYFYVIGIYRPNWNDIFPYRSILLEGW